jgi:DNA-binding beta-propeller fold protein YncE
MNERRLVWVLVLGCFIAAPAAGQWYEGTWAFPDTMLPLDGVYYVVPNPLTNRVYVSDEYTIAAFDAATREKVWQKDFPGKPVYLPGIERLYIIYDTAIVVDAHTDSVIGTARLFGQPPTELAYSSTSGKLYAPRYDTDSTDVVAVVDIQLDSVIARVSGWTFARHMAWDSTTNRLFVGDCDSSRIGVIDCGADTVIAWVSLSGNSSWLSISTASRRVFVGTTRGTIDIIDADSLRPVSSIEQVTEAPALVSPVTDRLYVSNAESLFVIDCAAGLVRARLAMADDVGILCANPLSGRVYVNDDGSPLVTVVDTNDVITDSVTPVAGDYVATLTFSPTRNELYVGTGPGRVAIVDAAVDTVKAIIDYTPLAFRSIVYNPSGGKLYALSSIQDGLYIISSSGQIVGVLPMRTSSSAVMLHDPGLNRLYIVDYQQLRVVDCNADSVVTVQSVADIDKGLLVQPDASKLYVFPRASTSGGFVRVYDCYRDSVVRTVDLGDDVPCAAYLSTTNRVYFAKNGPSFLYSLDVERDSVVDSVFIGRVSSYGRLLADGRNGLLYVHADGEDLVSIVDARRDSLLFSLRVPASLDTMFLSEASNKLYIANRASAGLTYVLDLNLRRITDTLTYGPSRCGMVNPRNDKLYFASSAVMTVVDCRYDSVVAVLSSIGSSVYGMAWDAVNNRVFAAGGSRVAVYRDDPYGIEEDAGAAARFGLALLANPVRGIARFRCTVPAGEKARLVVCDALGRRVVALDVRGGDVPVNVTWSGADARGQRMAAGVYFAQLVAGRDRATVKVVLE